MSEETSVKNPEIVSDEQWSTVSMKPCKSAARAQKKREKTEWVKERDAKWQLEQSIGEPISQDDFEDYKVGLQKLADGESDAGDDTIYERAPSPLPNPFLINKLCLVCIRCPRAGLIEYPSGYGLSDKLGCLIYNESSLATTICRTCYNKHSGSETQDQLIDMMKAIKVSPTHFSFGGVYRSMAPTTTILTHEDGIAYIPLKSISNSLDDSCVLKSMIASSDGYSASDLRGGFF